MRISVASIDDAPRACALFSAAFDDRVITVAGVRYRQASARPEDRMLFSARSRTASSSGGRSVAWTSSPRRARRASRASSSILPIAARESARPSGTVSRRTSRRSTRGASSRTAGPTPTRWRSPAVRIQPRGDRHHVGRRSAHDRRAARAAGRDRNCADGRLPRRPDAHLRSRQRRARWTSLAPPIFRERPTRAGGV